MKNCLFIIFFSALFAISSAFLSCAGIAVSAEEYYSIGMAYFELGKYEDAEKWLSRAKQAKRTMVASTYNLGRLAFEMERYDEAARYFENILKKDKDNVLALKAAAYTRIKTGDIAKAEKHYARLLELVPESADDGYNHALILFAMGRYTAAEEVISRYPIALLENKDVMLLNARNQNAQDKVEAIESYASYLMLYTDVKARYEYAGALEKHELYARSLEEFRKAFSDASSDSTDPKKNVIRFGIARVLLIADGSSSEGMTELKGAVDDGFDDIEAVEKLTNLVIASNRDTVREIVSGMRSKKLETNP